MVYVPRRRITQLGVVFLVGVIVFLLFLHDEIDSNELLKDVHDDSKDKQNISFYQDLQNGVGEHNVLHSGSQPNCQPHRSVSFIKIHRVGSGAMHNVLLRLALRNNLTVALPRCEGSKNHYQMFPQTAQQQYMLNQAPLKDYRDYNVFFDHAVYDKSAQLAYMADDVRFFTQIRYPFSQAESVFHHFGGPKIFGLQLEPSPLAAFLNSHHKEYMFKGQCYHSPRKSPVTRNFQVFTLGYTDALANNMTHFKSYLQKLDTELFFVSLLEYSDESSILLRRKMCWHIRDVLNIQTHKTKKSNNADSASQIAAMEQAKVLHKQLSALDYMLYDHFKEKLLKLIEEQGVDFQEEVHHYKALNARFSQLCTTMCEDFSHIDASNITLVRKMLHEGVDIPATYFYSAFKLTYIDCLLQITKEVIDKRVLKLYQYPTVCDSKQRLHLYGLDEQDCDFSQHVYPGYNINYFKEKILNSEACLGNYFGS